MNVISIIWLGIIALCIFIELVTPSALISIWFVSGGIVAFLLSLYDVELFVQIIFFLLISISTIIVLRPIASRYVKVNKIATNADRYIDEEGVVLKTISKDEWGQVKVQGTIWSAISIDQNTIEKDERVKVVSIDGAKLIVKKK